jgi:hypothetical protein
MEPALVAEGRGGVSDDRGPAEYSVFHPVRYAADAGTGRLTPGPFKGIEAE